MGSGSWSASTYKATTGASIAAGTTFGYSTSTRATTPAAAWTAHEDLDPKKVAGAGSPLAGMIVRESRDSVDHPNSVPVAVFFDETGSMGDIPVVVQQKLSDLFGLLLTKGYVEDPQVLVGAYGDHECDRVPLQVSQFESDNRVDDALDKIFIEGNGGGNGGESMSLAWYYLAHHTATDALDKRGKKGYAFFIGDEVALELSGKAVSTLVGDGEPLGKLDNKSVVADLLKSWDAFVLVIDNWSAKSQGSIKFYTDLFGRDRVLIVEDPESIAETIALSIGVLEGTVDLDEGVDDLKSIGATDSAIRSASKSLATVSASRRVGQVVVSNAPTGLEKVHSDEDSLERL